MRLSFDDKLVSIREHIANRAAAAAAADPLSRRR